MKNDHLDHTFIFEGTSYFSFFAGHYQAQSKTYMRGDQKIPRIKKKKYLKYSYKFETLVTFKVFLM